MKNPTRIKPLIALIALALILAACEFPFTNTEEQVALGVAQTQVAMTQTALSEGAEPAQADPDSNGPDGNGPQADAPPPEPTATQTPEPAITPTETLTPTLDVPMVSVNRNTNCRTGPGEPYDIIGALLTNQEAEVLGVSSDGGTWIIKNPDRPGEECWLWGLYATVNGPTEGLPVHTPPPTPTPAFSWTGSWTTYNFVPGDPPDEFPMTITVDGSNFTGTVILDPAYIITLTGTISNDALTVSGNWTSPTVGGSFTFFALGTNQFQGSGVRDGILAAWCGGRDGAGMPATCLKE